MSLISRRTIALGASIALVSSSLPLIASSAIAGTLSGDCPVAAVGYASGDGSLGDPFLITAPAELQLLSESPGDWGLNFELTEDIDMTGDPAAGTCTWDTGIGNTANPFTGVFEGNDHTISGLNITVSLPDLVVYAGLFGLVEAPGAINGVSLSGADVFGEGLGSVYAGSIVGFMDGGSLTNVVATEGSVTAQSTAAEGSGEHASAGGLTGSLDASVALATGLSFTGNVDAIAEDEAYAGGIAGRNFATLDNVSTVAPGAVAASSATTLAHAGGIAGLNEGTITSAVNGLLVNAVSLPDVLAINQVAVAGGIAGHHAGLGSISNSGSTGNVSASSNSSIAGGIVGTADAALDQVASQGQVSAVSLDLVARTAVAGGIAGRLLGNASLDQAYTVANVSSDAQAGDSDALAGGIVGLADAGSTVSNAATRGDVVAAGTYAALAGGVAGINGGDWLNAYSANFTGAVASVDVYLGGFFGSNSGTATASFWDNEASSAPATVGTGVTPAGVTAGTTAELTDFATYDTAGWDIVADANPAAVWNWCPNVNSGYPLLAGLFPADSCGMVTPQSQILDAFVDVPVTDTATLQADYFGGAVTYSIAPALPAGLDFDTTTGVVSGTPTAPSAQASYTVEGTDGVQTASVDILIQVVEASLSPDTQIVSGEVGSPIANTAVFVADNFAGAVAYSIAPALPAGLDFDTATGVVSGTPTVVWPATLHTVTATSGPQSVTATIGITVSEAPGPDPDPVAPSAPLNVSGSSGDKSVTVSWSAPASSGSFPVTFYQAIATPGGASCLVQAPALSCTVTGLTNGTAYTFRVRALNGAGWSPDSPESAAVTPEGPPVPPEPATIVVSSGDRKGKTVVVEGFTTGDLAGKRIVPWIKFPGQSGYAKGKARTVADDGTFKWTRKTNKKVYVYFKVGNVQSLRVVIPKR